MYRFSIGFALLVPALVLAAAPPEEKERLRNVPGPFHPYNITGQFEGRYHCPISEQDLDPTVLILTRESDPTQVAALKKLVEDLRIIAVKNRETRLTCVVVFLHKLETPRDDGKGKEVKEKGLEADATLEKQNTIEDNRLELAEKLKLWVSSLEPAPMPPKAEGAKKFREKDPLVVCIADPAEVAHFKLADSDRTLIILYSKLEVQSALTVEQLTDENVKAILTDVREKFGAVRK